MDSCACVWQPSQLQVRTGCSVFLLAGRPCGLLHTLQAAAEQSNRVRASKWHGDCVDKRPRGSCRTQAATTEQRRAADHMHCGCQAFRSHHSGGTLATHSSCHVVLLAPETARARLRVRCNEAHKGICLQGILVCAARELPDSTLDCCTARKPAAHSTLNPDKLLSFWEMPRWQAVLWHLCQLKPMVPERHASRSTAVHSI